MKIIPNHEHSDLGTPRSGVEGPDRESSIGKMLKALEAALNEFLMRQESRSEN